MLLTLELGIRFLHLVPDNAPITYVAIPGDEGYSPAPGAEGRSMFGIVHRINTLGLRDRERATEKPAGTYRVVVVGDSVVYAHGVAQEEGLVAQLERLLQSRGHYDVWNLGVEGYNLFNENARYARFAPTLKPDLAVVVILFNDLLPRSADLRVTSVGTLAAKGRTAPYPDRWRPQLEASALFTALNSHLFNDRPGSIFFRPLAVLPDDGIGTRSISSDLSQAWCPSRPDTHVRTFARRRGLSEARQPLGGVFSASGDLVPWPR